MDRVDKQWTGKLSDVNNTSDWQVKKFGWWTKDKNIENQMFRKSKLLDVVLGVFLKVP